MRIVSGRPPPPQGPGRGGGRGGGGGEEGAGGVGRILTCLRQRGALTAPVLWRVKRRRGTAGRPWALRKPKDYAVEKPGDLVQLDTLDLRPSAWRGPETIHGSRQGLAPGRGRRASSRHPPRRGRCPWCAPAA